MDICIVWRLGFRQCSFHRIARIARRTAPYAWTQSPLSWHALVPQYPFEPRSAIRFKNLPPSSSRLRREYDRAPRGAISPYHADPPARRSRPPGHDRRFPGMRFSPFTLSDHGSAIRSRDISSRPCPLRERYNAAPRGAATTLIGRTGRWISTRPQAALPRPPARPSDRCDETASAVSSTSICRSHDVTEFSAPTRCAELIVTPPCCGFGAILPCPILLSFSPFAFVVATEYSQPLAVRDRPSPRPAGSADPSALRCAHPTPDPSRRPRRRRRGGTSAGDPCDGSSTPRRPATPGPGRTATTRRPTTRRNSDRPSSVRSNATPSSWLSRR